MELYDCFVNSAVSVRKLFLIAHTVWTENLSTYAADIS